MSNEISSEANQYLTFTLGKEDFALNINQVREVLNYTEVTSVPRMPEFVKGVINLRGNVVPVIDLKLKLGMNRTETTAETCIVIVEVLLENEMNQMGILIDSVKAVIDLDEEQIAPPPKVGSKIRNDFIIGMGHLEERFIILLNINMVLSDDEIYMLREGHEEIGEAADVEKKDWKEESQAGDVADLMETSSS